MSDLSSKPSTAFDGDRLLFSGPLAATAIAVKRASETGASAIIVFDDATGRVVDLDLRGTDAEIVERLSQPPQAFTGRYRSRAEGAETSGDSEPEPKTRGRPKLGVVSREVTLLPKQWDWLAEQPSGASATLRRLVDDARRKGDPHRDKRAAQEAAYQFMLAIAGNLPGYEDATRALFADDRAGLEERIAGWPEDIRSHALRLAFDTRNRSA